VAEGRRERANAMHVHCYRYILYVGGEMAKSQNERRYSNYCKTKRNSRIRNPKQEAPAIRNSEVTQELAKGQIPLYGRPRLPRNFP